MTSKTMALLGGIEWRLRSVIARRLPIFYHLIFNGRLPRESLNDGEWLAAYWDEPSWQWPTKCSLIERITSADMRILDVGTGTASIVRHLQAKGYHKLAAMDAAKLPITRLQAANVDARQALLPEIPFPSESFDVVIASQVLEHIVARRSFLREVERVLAPTGCFVVFVPDECLTPIDEPTHVAVYSRKSLSRFLSRRFDVLQIDSIRDSNHPMPVLFAVARRR